MNNMLSKINHMRLLTNIFLGLACLASAARLPAQSVDIPQTQRVVIVKKTADWCPNCGQWGWTLFNQLVTDQAERATVFAAHYSGGLSNAVATAIAANLPGASQPRFYVNQSDMNANSGNGTTVRNQVNVQVDNAGQQSPVAQTGILATYEGNRLFIRTRTRLFQNWTDGELFLGVYLIERSFTGNQSGQGANAQHKQLLRSVVRGEWYGVPILSGSSTDGLLPEMADTVTLGNLSPQNLEIATILWRRNGNGFAVVNTNSTRNITELVSATNDPAVFPGIAFVVAPNRLESNSVARITLAEAQPLVNISVFNIGGQHLTTIYDSALGSGSFEFPLEHLLGLPSGVYIVKLRVEDQQHIQRVVVP
jgi:hypothetical protein